MRNIQVIQRVQSLYSKGVQSDDSRLSGRHVYNVLITLRSKLLSQKFKKKQMLSDWDYSILPCVEVIEVDAHECPCLPQIGCKVYRTRYELPKPLQGYNSYIIDWVRSVEKSIRINETTRNEEQYASGRKYTSNQKRFLIEGGYLYFYGGSVGEAVSIKFLAQDPIEVSNFISYCDTNAAICIDPLNAEFHLNEDLIEDLVMMCYNELIIMFNQVTEDSTSDTRDNPKQETK